MESDKKVYVSVAAAFRDDGTIMPTEITWGDGQRYQIDRVLDIRQSAAIKVGGQGDRYTIRVKGKVTYLFFERSPNTSGNNLGRWFVERR